jgi:hypothetical protein
MMARIKDGKETEVTGARDRVKILKKGATSLTRYC